MSFMVNPYSFGSSIPATDPDFASTILLLSGDGADGSNTFTDESAAAHGAATVLGQAQVSDSEVVFGNGSIRFDSGGDDALSFADHADWTIGTSDFTLELWLRLADVVSTFTIISHYSTTSNQRGWNLQYNGTGKTLRFNVSSDGSTLVILAGGTFNPTVDTWYYVCVERSGSTGRMYTATAPGGAATMLNGRSNSTNIMNSTAPLRISGNANNVEELYGNIDELRFTLGVARYADDGGYTAPSAAFPRS
jgi:hypothetical protein